MRIACTGYRGRVGKVFLSNPNVVPLDCDVRDTLQVQRELKYKRPDLVVHLAARSDVDYCEKKVNEQDVIDVNFLGTANVAEEVSRYGCGMVLISSGHIFSGKRWFGKYKENDKPQPMNFYGLSKLSAEGLGSVYDNMKIVRISSLFDDTRIALERGKMGLVGYPVFMRRSFLYLPHFSNLLYEYCTRFDEMPKVLHLAGNDSVSYYEFMSDVVDVLGMHFSVRPRRNDIENGFAPRGHNLGLDISRAIKLGLHCYSYLDGLREMKE